MKIPNLAHAKLVRVDKNKNKLLVWFGGKYIKIYSLKTGQEDNVITVEDPIKINWVSFSAVKNKMRNYILE